MNTKHGDQITLKMNSLNGDDTIKALNPSDCHIVLEAEQVLEIKGS